MVPGTRIRRGSVGAFTAVCLLVAAGAATSASTAARAQTSWRAILATLPANADVAHPDVHVNAISCASPGNCSAVGWYIDRSGLGEGLLLNEKAGHWTFGPEWVLPTGVSLTSVSCPSAGNCTAVGTFDGTRYGETDGLLLTEKAGHWKTGVTAAVPANSGAYGSFVLHSVSCASAGNCTAVGSFDNAAVLLNEKAGRWGRAVYETAYVGPSLAGSELYSVSCASDGSCSAAGYYALEVGRNDNSVGYPVLLTNRTGKWRHVDVVLPPDANGGGAELTSVSCAPHWNCSAVGSYNISIDTGSAGRGVLLTEKAGKWLPGIHAVPPKNADSGYWKGYVGLDGISCAGPGACVAIGTYSVGGDHFRWTLLTEKAGTWRPGVEPALPSDAKIPVTDSISCASPGNCTVVGTYSDGSGGIYNEDVGQHGFLLTESGGRWAPGVTAPLARSIIAVSCASPGNCGAVGTDGRGKGVLLDSTTAH